MTVDHVGLDSIKHSEGVIALCTKCGSTNRTANGHNKTKCRDCDLRRKRESHRHQRRPLPLTPEQRAAYKVAYMKRYLKEYNKRPGIRARKAALALASYHRLDPAVRFQRYLQNRYGMSLDEYHAKFEFNGERCAICRGDFDLRTPMRRPHVDHNHNSKRVRDLLCGQCNRMLGIAKENPATLRAGAAYIEQWDEKAREYDR